ncbi:MAG: hypothetical protein Q9Q40_08785 [Acidobacteriota bacterium]|nr:hypothetical protein [Acidobacteriota bacterium]MDQ7087992.1 hypothetical protein [Acidobacteriota bacterium]
MYVTTRRRSGRKGLGLLALGGAVLVPVAGLLLAAMSADQPAAPAILGGGGTMIGIFLGRWGLREMQASRRIRVR